MHEAVCWVWHSRNSLFWFCWEDRADIALVGDSIHSIELPTDTQMNHAHTRPHTGTYAPIKCFLKHPNREREKKIIKSRSEHCNAPNTTVRCIRAPEQVYSYAPKTRTHTQRPAAFLLGMRMHRALTLGSMCMGYLMMKPSPWRLMIIWSDILSSGGLSAHAEGAYVVCIRWDRIHHRIKQLLLAQVRCLVFIRVMLGLLTRL